jgi:hypothetical protein
MRAFVLKTFIVALLFAGLEGAAESVGDTDFHQTHHAHADDVDNQWVPDSDGSDHEGDSCEHFCHAHAVALTTQFSFPSMPMIQYDVPVHSAHTVTRRAAPPIPPPNI